MDQNTLVQMLRLRTLAARKGLPFNVERFATDRPYAKSTLKGLLLADDEELHAACRQMMDTLRLRAPSKTDDLASTMSPETLDTQPAEPEPEAPAAEPRELVDSGWP